MAARVQAIATKRRAGKYLRTAITAGQAGPAAVFRRYKGQHVVERRHGEFKGPLAVAPISWNSTGASPH